MPSLTDRAKAYARALEGKSPMDSALAQELEGQAGVVNSLEMLANALSGPAMLATKQQLSRERHELAEMLKRAMRWMDDCRRRRPAPSQRDMARRAAQKRERRDGT